MNEIIDQRYTLMEKLGEGASGTVYRASDPRLSRQVAIKIFSATHDDTARQRFLREMQVAAKLEHPAIVPVYDFSYFDDQPFYVMRFMEGGSLEDYLKNRQLLSPQEASGFLDRLADGLDTIHQAGLVHRNIKPSNILLDSALQPYLGDFTIVHTSQASTQAFVGTPTYMAPEQYMGEALDNRTDIYLLGLILFEMLTGERPFRGTTLQEIMRERIQTHNVPSLHTINPSLSADYDKVIARALAKNPADRYETATQMAQEFAILTKTSSQVVIGQPVKNPFVVGNPVAGNLFVGRAEIFSRLRELWGNDATLNVNSVVLFGHRRMGKTSILQNLDRYFDRETIVADLTMQRVGRINHTGELLSYLALAIYDALDDADLPIDEPNLDLYEANGYVAFNRFLRDVRQLLNGSSRKSNSKQSFLNRLFGNKNKNDAPPDDVALPKRIILTIDEFELIETAIEDDRVDAEFLDFLRGVIHSEPWLILALAGLHTLEEMTADYWNPLFASVTPVRVSFFSRTATGNLLSNLGEDFPLTFTNATADRIFALVQGQPYLTQLIAYSLVSDYNADKFERNETRAPEFTPGDVNKVIASRNFYDQGSYYFNGVWGQAEKLGKGGQTRIMEALAQNETPLSTEELQLQTTLDAVAVQDSLAILQQHDVLKQVGNGRFTFTVPLMQRWIQDVKL